MAGRGTYAGSLVIFVAAAFSVGLVTGVNIAGTGGKAEEPCPVENPPAAAIVKTTEYPEAAGFTLTEVETGESLSLKELKGTNSVMLIATTTCPVCREQIDELKTIYEKYKEKGIRFFEAIIGEADESGLRFVDEVQAEEHVRESGLPFPAYIDEIDEIPAGYTFESVPVLAFITKEGRLMAQRPFTYASDVAKILDALMAGKTIDTSSMKTRTG